NFVYYPSGSGASLMHTATRCKPDSTQANPVYSFAYNALGQTLNSTDPTGLVVANSYDTAANGGNLLTTTVDPTAFDPSGINAVTSYGYDALENTTSVTDPRGYVTENTYDADRRKTTVLHHNGNIAAALLAAEQTQYDQLGRDLEDDAAATMSGVTVTAWQMVSKRTFTGN